MGAVKAAKHTPSVCLVGMPNAGKTTLMNALTGSNLHTANYAGVTVTLSEGQTKKEFGEPLNIIDLPGVNSPIAPSPEEELSCQVIADKHHSVKADALILVVDATQLERHLRLAAYAAKSGKPAVVAITMIDLLERMNLTLDIARLAKVLKLPIFAVDGRHATGMAGLVEGVKTALTHSGSDNELKLLPEDATSAYQRLRSLLSESGALQSADQSVQTPTSPSVTEATPKQQAQPYLQQRIIDTFTARIDRWTLHRYWGFPIFFLTLGILFGSIFWAARPFMDLVEWGFDKTSNTVLYILGDGIISQFIANGVIKGVGSVAVFFPQIVILFFLMTLLEDSGYLARGATLVDRPLSALGLQGRSFVPMLSGFACAIPAVLATRAIPGRRERLLTIWILPLMSCSARLPVYALLLAALLPKDTWRSGLYLAFIYIASLLISALVAGLASRLTSGRKRSLSLLAMELPAYRVPQWKPILRMTWTRSATYLKKAGGPIVVISTILWLLSNFGLAARQPQVPDQLPSKNLIATSKLDHSFVAQMGQVMEPALRPMGIDWRVGVGLISAFAAREVFVSTMAIVFGIPEESESAQDSLLEKMQAATFTNSPQKVFTTSSIVGLIVYFFFALQCLSTVAVVRRETNSWNIALVQLAFYTTLGYILSVITVQGLRWLGIA